MKQRQRRDQHPLSGARIVSQVSQVALKLDMLKNARYILQASL